MNESGVSPRRRRNTILAALELFRGLGIPRGFNAMLTFLYVCENEGLTVTELAQVTRMSVASAARLTRIVAGSDPLEPAPAEAVLLELRPSTKDKRVSNVHLTERGREVRNQLERIIRDAAPICASSVSEAPFVDQTVVGPA